MQGYQVCSPQPVPFQFAMLPRLPSSLPFVNVTFLSNSDPLLVGLWEKWAVLPVGKVHSPHTPRIQALVSVTVVLPAGGLVVDRNPISYSL